MIQSHRNTAKFLIASQHLKRKNTGTQLLIVIIDATWNVNACYYEVSFASAIL